MPSPLFRKTTWRSGHYDRAQEEVHVAIEIDIECFYGLVSGSENTGRQRSACCNVSEGVDALLAINAHALIGDGRQICLEVIVEIGGCNSNCLRTLPRHSDPCTSYNLKGIPVAK